MNKLFKQEAIRTLEGLAGLWECGNEQAKDILDIATVFVFRGMYAAKYSTTKDYFEEKDKVLEELWEDFTDVPMNPETECIEAPFLCFPAGKHREEIWEFFDHEYSRGVHALMYGDTVPDKVLLSAMEHCSHDKSEGFQNCAGCPYEKDIRRCDDIMKLAYDRLKELLESNKTL